jgi:hypothetical protein
MIFGGEVSEEGRTKREKNNRLGDEANESEGRRDPSYIFGHTTRDPISHAPAEENEERDSDKGEK